MANSGITTLTIMEGLAVTTRAVDHIKLRLTLFLKPVLLLIFLASALSLLGIGFYRYVFSVSYNISPMAMTYVGLAYVFIVFCAALPLQYSAMPKSLVLLTRWASVVALLYLISNRPIIPTPTDASPLEAITVKVVWIYYGLALVAGGFALIRPAFAVLPAIFMVWAKRGAAEAVTGLKYTQVADVKPITELLLFIIIAMGIMYWGGLILEWATSKRARRQRAVAEFRESWPRLVFLFALASHFANYGYSGIAKLSLNGGLHSWLIENDPTRIMLVALDNGHIFYSANAELTAFVVNSLASYHLFSNTAVMFAQIAAFFVFLAGARFLMLLTIFFDVMHLAVFGTVGANFWPWIGLNLSILAAVAYFDLNHEPWLHRGLATIVIVIAPVFFSTLWLGWYDTGANNKTYFVAVDKKGIEHVVPANYFTFYSYPFGHMRFGAVPPGPHFPTSTNGGSGDIAALRAGQACDFTGLPLVGRHLWDGGAIARYIKAYHNWILGEVDATGRFNYDLYAHHFFSPAHLTASFRELDKRDITTYIYRTESVCLSWDGSNLQRDVLSTSDFRIDVGS